MAIARASGHRQRIAHARAGTAGKGFAQCPRRPVRGHVVRAGLPVLLAALSWTSIFWSGGAQGGSTGGGDSGERLYLRNCAVCHGPEGEGAMPGVPDLTARPGPLDRPDDTLVRRVREGIRGPDGSVLMPAGGGNASLTAAQVRAIVGFMRRSVRK